MRPGANRVASNEPRAPFANSTIMNAASSTVTFPVPPFTLPLKVPEAASSGSGRSVMKFAVMPVTFLMSPTR